MPRERGRDARRKAAWRLQRPCSATRQDRPAARGRPRWARGTADRRGWIRICAPGQCASGLGRTWISNLMPLVLLIVTWAMLARGRPKSAASAAATPL